MSLSFPIMSQISGYKGGANGNSLLVSMFLAKAQGISQMRKKMNDVT